MGWVVNVTSRPFLPPGKDPVPIVQEAGWAAEQVWTSAENLASTGIRSPVRPTRSESKCRLPYPGLRTGYSGLSIVLFIVTILLSCSTKCKNILRHRVLKKKCCKKTINRGNVDNWLTVPRITSLVDFELDAQYSYLFTYNTFIKILYMFRALPCSFSGGLRRNCIYAASGIVTLCR